MAAARLAKQEMEKGNFTQPQSKVGLSTSKKNSTSKKKKGEVAVIYTTTKAESGR